MLDNIRNQIKNLSISERILLVEDIWDSIANEEQSFELTDKQKKLVRRRSKELKDNPAVGKKWEEISL